MNLANRKYQLAIALFEFSKDHEEIFYSQSIKLFDQCMDIARDRMDKSQSYYVMQILCLTKKAFALIQICEYSKAQTQIDEANRYMQEINQGHQQENSIIREAFRENDGVYLDVFANM